MLSTSNLSTHTAHSVPCTSPEAAHSSVPTRPSSPSPCRHHRFPGDTNSLPPGLIPSPSDSFFTLQPGDFVQGKPDPITSTETLQWHQLAPQHGLRDLPACSGPVDVSPPAPAPGLQPHWGCLAIPGFLLPQGLCTSSPSPTVLQSSPKSSISPGSLWPSAPWMA